MHENFIWGLFGCVISYKQQYMIDSLDNDRNLTNPKSSLRSIAVMPRLSMLSLYTLLILSNLYLLGKTGWYIRSCQEGVSCAQVAVAACSPSALHGRSCIVI